MGAPPPPTPPVKIVEGGVLRSDIEDVWLRRSRMPALVGLDLRAKIGANHMAQERLNELVDRYGARTVKAVMRRILDNTEQRVRAKLAAIPDGQWSAVAYQDSAREGDEGLYRILLTLTKRGDTLHFDFTGTDPQADGLINCTHAGVRGGMTPATAHRALRRHPVGARRGLPVRRDHQRAGIAERLHLPGGGQQGLGRLGVGDPQRRHRVPGRHARHP